VDIKAAPICTSGLKLKKSVLNISNLSKSFGSQAIKFTGALKFSAASVSSFNAASNGAQIIIEDANSVLYELSERTAPIAGGAPGSACGAGDGWNGESYSNASDALPGLACGPNSANGLKTLVYSSKAGKPLDRTLNFTTSASRALSPSSDKVKVTVFFGSTSSFGANGQCATASFVGKQCKVKGGLAVCNQKARR